MPEIGLSSSQFDELAFFLMVNLSVSKFFLNKTNSYRIFENDWKRGAPYSQDEISKKGGLSQLPYLLYPKSTTG